MSGAEQHAAFVFVCWAGNADLWNATKKRKVVHTGMGGAVGADNACTVQREHHGQFVQSHVMNELVIRTLQKRGVNRHYGL